MKIIPKEHQIQKSIIEWAKYSPILREYLVCIENERKTSPIQGLNRKRMGVKSGVSDLFLAYPNGGKHGLWIELKRDKKSIVSASQQSWIDKMNSISYEAKVAYGFEDAKKIIETYLKL